MSGLAGRIAARLDALEAGARAAHGPEWLVDDDDPAVILRPDKPGNTWDGFVIARMQEDGFGLIDHGNAAHIAAWDPAAVLRLVDGLRAVVGEHSVPLGLRSSLRCCPSCRTPMPCDTLLGIAAALGVEVGE